MENNSYTLEFTEARMLDFVLETKEGKYAEVNVVPIMFVPYQETNTLVVAEAEDHFYYGIR